LTVELDRATSVEEINQAMRSAAELPMRGILEYSDAPIVSSDIIGNTHSSIFDAPLTQVIEGNLAKVISWYDNEWGYSARVADLIARIGKLDGMEPGEG
jgi:glyceraldehyde 3-phosphate dehydrogenase